MYVHLFFEKNKKKIRCFVEVCCIFVSTIKRLSAIILQQKILQPCLKLNFIPDLTN